MSDGSHWLDNVHLVIAGQCLPSVLTNWSFSLTPHWCFFSLSLSLLELAVSVCNATSPRASLCLRKGITTENRFQVPSDVFTLTEHKVLVCLNLLKNEASQNIHIPGVATRYVGGLDGLPCGKNWPRKTSAVLSGPFLEPPGTAQTVRQRKKKTERINVYSPEIRHLNSLMRWTTYLSRRVFTSTHSSFTSSKLIIFGPFFFRNHFLLLKVFFLQVNKKHFETCTEVTEALFFQTWIAWYEWTQKEPVVQYIYIILVFPHIAAHRHCCWTRTALIFSRISN